MSWVVLSMVGFFPCLGVGAWWVGNINEMAGSLPGGGNTSPIAMGGDGQHRIATPKRVGTKLLRSRIGHPMTIDHQAILVLPGTEPGIADPSAVAIPVECVLLRIPVIEGTGHRDGQRGRILEFEADRNRPETGFGSDGGGGVPVFGDGAVAGVFHGGGAPRGPAGFTPGRSPIGWNERRP